MASRPPLIDTIHGDTGPVCQGRLLQYLRGHPSNDGDYCRAEDTPSSRPMASVSIDSLTLSLMRLLRSP